jgi:hypothetical protein
VTTEVNLRLRIGWIASLVIAAIYGGLALTVDFKTAAIGIQSDEATYYLMGYSLAEDGDLEYRVEDLERGFREFPSGPSGIFLKRGTDVTGFRLTPQPPFVAFPGVPDPDESRLYFGKSFAYPLLAAPFVKILGTNGFLVVNALLLWALFFVVYLFTSARSGAWIGALWAGAFVFASVVPVYFVWIAPELFNCAVGGVAYFLWLYKYANPTASTRAGRWLRDTWTDWAAAALIGVLTFSKVTNVLLLLPMLAWFFGTRAWRQGLVVGALAGIVAAGAFGLNVASSGEWNYQGGDRATCYDRYPMQAPGQGLEVCPERGRSESLSNVIFDPEMFWSNLRANVVYFVVGRNSGLVAYFFPVLFAAGALVATWRRSAGWQWLVLGGVVTQIAVFIITLPYTYYGDGGSVGNRYFMGAYGVCAFLLPAMTSVRLMAVPWIVGGLFVAKLVLNPFYTSVRPGDHSMSGLFRLLPIELTNVNSWPLGTDASRVRIWYGDSGAGDPGFQIYYLDQNSYLQEADKQSFWTRGESTAEVLIKTDRPYRRMQITLTAGAEPADVSVTLNGRTNRATLAPGQSTTMQMALGPGFPYKHEREVPAYNWLMKISSSSGFVPAITEPGSIDRRFLGVRVRPIITE